ncbi:MAG: phosphatidylserine/phosphatidylglycerophosphate/cardiolipin synthase family protein [bacterium]
MIRDSSRFLYISTFYYELDKYGLEFLAELMSALKRGVSVTLIIDSFGQKLAATLMSTAQRAELRARLLALQNASARVIIYRPGKPLQRVLGSGYHIKIQVSDSGEALFSSGNISRLSYEKWMEFAVSLRGPVTVTLLAELLKLIGDPDDSHISYLSRFSLADRQPGSQIVRCRYISYNPCDDPSPLSPIRQRHPNPLTTNLVNVINSARKSILLSSFYYKPEPGLFQAIEKAAQRGVHVEIYHSHRDALEVTKVAWVVASLGYPRLLDAGVKIYEHIDGQHTKFVLIDDKWVWLGSYNFEYAAHDRLAEAMLVTEDHSIVAVIQRFFAECRRDPKSIRVPRDAIAQLPVWLKVYRLLCYPFKRWLQ